MIMQLVYMGFSDAEQKTTTSPSSQLMRDDGVATAEDLVMTHVS